MNAIERLKEYFKNNDLTKEQKNELTVIVEQSHEEGYDDGVDNERNDY